MSILLIHVGIFIAQHQITFQRYAAITTFKTTLRLFLLQKRVAGFPDPHVRCEC